MKEINIIIIIRMKIIKEIIMIIIIINTMIMNVLKLIGTK
jgi:hypothetical protein